MVTFPIAKINLGLNIIGKRVDGFHNIETIFYPVEICDALEIVVNGNQREKDSLFLSGNDPGGNPDENLVLKAASLLRLGYSFPYLRIHLHKGIPSGAGLGGGSSDASFMLKSIIRLFDIQITQEELRSISLRLGSDCPFFIDSQPAFATGRGEKLEATDPFLKGYNIVLVRPAVAVSTREAYSGCIPVIPENHLKDVIKSPTHEWKNLIINDFEKTVFLKYPQLRRIKEQLYEAGAFYSSMSGSGSVIYGLFAERPSIPEEIEDLVIYDGII